MTQGQANMLAAVSIEVALDLGPEHIEALVSRFGEDWDRACWADENFAYEAACLDRTKRLRKSPGWWVRLVRGRY